MFCVKKSLRIATVYIYIKEEKRNAKNYRVQVKLENLNF